MRGVLAVVGLTGAVFVSGFAFSLGEDEAANEAIFGEVLMPGIWQPAVGLPVPFSRSGRHGLRTLPPWCRYYRRLLQRQAPAGRHH
jgi:hypothetical protein